MAITLPVRHLLVLFLGFGFSLLAPAVVFPFHNLSRQTSWCSTRLRRIPEYTKINPHHLSEDISFGDGVSLKYGIETVYGNYLGMERDVYYPDSFNRLYLLVNGEVVGFEVSSLKSVRDLKKNDKIKPLEGDEYFKYHRGLGLTLGKSWAAVIKEKLAGLKEGQVLQFQEISGTLRKGIFLRYGSLTSTREETIVMRNESTGKEEEVLLSFVVLPSIKLAP